MANNKAFSGIFKHRLHNMGTEGGTIDLTIPNNAGISDQFYKDKVAPTKMRWRIGNNKGLKMINDHVNTTTFRKAAPARIEETASLISSKA